ncbi:MAG: glycosyltransferase [Clostridium beijerinckii]|nr:glycosyltransferase [Clostridium beijerinckii]
MELSICMMVKDEEKNLDRCLKSLTPIIEEVNSELIIVDTGSTDRTVDIAKKYTNKVYFHKWNNDFSAMRNITIDYAKGKWILIIDADEEIEDSSEIIFFLKSQYKNKYKSVMVNVKNITNLDSNRYGILSSVRLFLNDGCFKYEGRVHNMPLYKTPTLSLKTVFIHYGYIETDGELMEKKFLRTSNLLIEEIKKNPENIYYNYQLAASYAMHKDYDKALEQMEKTYKLINDKKLNKKDYVQIYYEMATYYYFAGNSTKYEIIQRICKEGIELEEEYIDLYFLLGKISIFINNYTQARENYSKYLELMDNYENLSIYKNVTLKLYTLDKIEEVYYDLAFIHYRTQNYEVCLEYIQKLKSNAYIQKAFELIVNTYIYLEKYEELKEYYNKYILDLDIELLRTFYEYLEIAISNLNEEKDIVVMSVFSEDRNTYSFLNKVRVYFKNNQQNLGQTINEFIEVLDFNNQPDYFGDLIYYKLSLKEEFSNLLSNISENTIVRYLSYICKKYDDFCDVVQIYLNSIAYSQNNFMMIRFNKLLRKYILILNSEDKEFFEKNFLEYVNEGISYVNTIYSPHIIDNEMIYDVKNEEDAFFIFISKANEIKNYDEKGYIRHLRKALAIYPCMKLGIEILLEELKNKTSNVNNEFEKYKRQIKNAIKDFIERNELDNAEALISEYESIVNNDIELILFKSQISIKRLKV